MTCFALWLAGLSLIGLGIQLREDIPTIAAIASGLILLLGGLVLTPPGWQMGLEAIAVLALLWGSKQHWGLG
ncbi:MAG: hypothetical protein HC824_01950 [Synechococcales cyanobacterium RM1_1_8]|nr:hypothetical protein [Synechococcales cyanobacterium RM1_1_8]